MTNTCRKCYRPIKQSKWMKEQLAKGNDDHRRYHKNHCQTCNKDGKGKGGDCNRCSEGLNELSNLLSFSRN